MRENEALGLLTYPPTPATPQALDRPPLSPLEQKREYEQQAEALYAKAAALQVVAEREQALAALKLLGEVGATFEIDDANPCYVSGYIYLPDEPGMCISDAEARYFKLLGWEGYHESFTAEIPKQHGFKVSLQKVENKARKSREDADEDQRNLDKLRGVFGTDGEIHA